MSQSPQDPVLVQAIPIATTMRSNTLGLAGFVTSLVGVTFTGGLLCPVGLILSLFALRRQPRGFAVAGTVLGFFGSCWGCLAATIALPVLGVIGSAIALLLTGGVPAFETLDHMMQVKFAISVYENKNGAPPNTLADLQLPQDIIEDGWGTPLQYQLTNTPPVWNWTLQSAGSDQTLDASDMQFKGDFTAKPNTP